MTDTTNPQPDLPARLEAALTERFTENNNPFSAMRRHEKGPDGWPASHPVGPHQVAEVLRELLAAAPVPPSAPTERAAIRAEAFREAATAAEEFCYAEGYEGAADELESLLRRMAVEAPAPNRAGGETQQGGAESPTVCQGFQWIGQSFAVCERCGQPAWDHEGEEVAVEGAGPFDTRRTVRPWKPGQADAIRAKWEQPTAVSRPGKEA